jgi:hypothetical protein
MELKGNIKSITENSYSIVEKYIANYQMDCVNYHSRTMSLGRNAPIPAD